MTKGIVVKNLNVERQSRIICQVAELEIESGEHVLLIGPNGSGKSTLLRVLAGLEGDFTGICVHPVAPVLVHQKPFLFRGSVGFNVGYGLPRPNREQRVEQCLHDLGIKHLLSRRIDRLSGGEIRRVALARALAIRPEVLLLDEPFAEIDLEGQATICELINKLEHTTVVITTPARQLVPEELACRHVEILARR